MPRRKSKNQGDGTEGMSERDRKRFFAHLQNIENHIKSMVGKIGLKNNGKKDDTIPYVSGVISKKKSFEKKSCRCSKCLARRKSATRS